MNKHTNDYNFPCSMCDKKYKVRQSLKQHIRLKHEEQQVRCDICWKICRNTIDLAWHKRQMHDKSGFECHICKFRFKSQNILEKHKFTHQNHICTICKKMFTRKSHVTRHQVIHQRVQVDNKYNVKWIQSIPIIKEELSIDDCNNETIITEKLLSENGSCNTT